MQRRFGRAASLRLAGWDCVVYYHTIGKSSPHLAGVMHVRSSAGFERDMRFLRAHFEVVPLAALAGEADVANARPPRVAVCFDDGLDLYAPGIPEILARYRVPATVFVITSCIDNRRLMWRNAVAATIDGTRGHDLVEAYNALAAANGLPGIDRPSDAVQASRGWPTASKDALAESLWRRSGMPPMETYLAEHRPYLTTGQLRQWIGEGHAIGLHTATHPYCDRLEPRVVEAEIVEPAAFLAQTFDLDEIPFAYPFGARLPSEVEFDLVRRGIISCALGSGGFFPQGTPAHLMRRREVDRGVAVPLVLRPLLGLG